MKTTKDRISESMRSVSLNIEGKCKIKDDDLRLINKALGKWLDDRGILTTHIDLKVDSIEPPSGYEFVDENEMVGAIPSEVMVYVESGLYWTTCSPLEGQDWAEVSTKELIWAKPV